MILVPSILQYIYGYRYNPNVADGFSYNVPIIRDNLTDETLCTNDNYSFYKILERSTDITVVENCETSKVPRLAIMGEITAPKNYQLSRIITSPMRENSAIIYLYTEKGE